MTAHLFNPENEEALGRGTWCYTPPGPVQRLKAAGAKLPWLWAEDGDFVIESVKDHVPKGAVGNPWGWSRDAVRQLKRAGVARELMPSDEDIAKMRELSHRRYALDLRRRLDSTDDSQCFDNVEDAMAMVNRLDRGVMIKRPWSSTGRGVADGRLMRREAVERAIWDAIRVQGCAVVERAYGPKKLDFAALFMAGDEGVRLWGWSVFGCSDSGVYHGNRVASQDDILAEIAGHADIEAVKANASKLEQELVEMLGGCYRGPLGVDMMAWGDDGRFVPCIEINLRRTMGFVAADAHRVHGAEGRLTVIAEPPAGSLILSEGAGLAFTILKG